MSDIAVVQDEPFDVGGPIPIGTTTLIEASAGTGKTYTLTALCARFIAEHDVPIESILLVTFTRAATAELRERVRSRLVEAEAHLAEPCDPNTEDPVLRALDRSSSGEICSPEEREERRARLAHAVSNFDLANISTIHGFCSQIRASIGVLAEHNTDAIPAESETDLITQVCSDLYFRSLYAQPVSPFGTRKLSNFIELVKKARTLGDAAVEAASDTDYDEAAVTLVKAARIEIDRRLRQKGGQSFDSLLTSVRDSIRTDARLRNSLRDQFTVVLVDEFQDTDPVQWEIFRRVWADALDEPLAGVDDETTDPDDEISDDGYDAVGHRFARSETTPEQTISGLDGRPLALFLVGDPKQAIYSFRGGDVYTYLSAKSRASTRALTTNQRSDPAVLAAMNAMAVGQAFGEDDIVYQAVATAQRNLARRAYDARDPDSPTLPGLAVRYLEPGDGGAVRNDAPGVRRAIAADVAVVAHHLLDGVEYLDTNGRAHRVRPSDIAVLVGATFEAKPIADALRRARIPVVLRLRDDVADSDARDQWRVLLHALDRPASTARAAAVALTWFFGWTSERLARATATERDTADRQDFVALQQELAAWATVLAEGGMSALYGQARRSNDMVARLLAGDDGERNLTDIEHLAELIHAEARAGGRDLTAGTALEILETLGGTPDDEVAADNSQRRIESDAEAVQIMTIHGSKGLEFPFVLLPCSYGGGKRVEAGRPLTFYDKKREERVIDLSSTKDPATGKDRPKRSLTESEKSAEEETKRQNCGDQHRMTYVALTRGKHQTVAWWAPTGKGANLSGLSRLLLTDGTEPAHKTIELKKIDVFGAITAKIDDVNKARSDNTEAAHDSTLKEVVSLRHLDASVKLDPAALPPLALDTGPSTDPGALREAVLARTLDRLGKVWSFSSIAKDLHLAVPEHQAGDPAVEASDDKKAADETPGQDSPKAADEIDPHHPAPVRPADQGDWDQPSPFDGLGGGKDFGNLVHHVLEVVDFQAPDLEDAIGRALDRPIGYRVTEAQRERLPVTLANAIRTPLGSQFSDLRLADLTPRDRLNELTFHFGLAPEEPVSAGLIGSVVADHLPHSDPLHAWARGLQRGLAGLDLQGFLNGSIDLTLRQTVNGATRYSVVDYKTNNLAPGEPGPTLQSYRDRHVTRAMAENQYALQALVYSVALHRYLRWRVPNYDPAVHLGPVGYLYVRGMVGPHTPTQTTADGHTTRAGVFAWQVPHQLVADLSSLFAGHHATRSAAPGSATDSDRDPSGDPTGGIR